MSSITKEEATLTFKSLLGSGPINGLSHTEVATVPVVRNYKLIILVLVIIIAVAVGLWWWWSRRSKPINVKSYILTPSIKGVKVSSNIGKEVLNVILPLPISNIKLK